MKLIIDDFVSPEIKEYLECQTGIITVELENKSDVTIIDIKYNENTTSEIIMKHIELFQKNNFPTLCGFDKDTSAKLKTLTYKIDSICCEYCYKDLVREMFKNSNIKSVKSNFDLHNSNKSFELFIEYNMNYNEKELIEFIKDNK